jgi:hypothetical protein
VAKSILPGCEALPSSMTQLCEVIFPTQQVVFNNLI